MAQPHETACMSAFLTSNPLPLLAPKLVALAFSSQVACNHCSTACGVNTLQVKAETDLDRLLLSDAATDEAWWRDFHEEEVVVKLAIADRIWDEVIAETAYLVEDMTWTLASQQPIAAV